MEYDADTVYGLLGADLGRLQAVMLRLFSERRMDGDAMRDAAQVVEAVLRQAVPLPEPLPEKV